MVPRPVSFFWDGTNALSDIDFANARTAYNDN